MKNLNQWLDFQENSHPKSWDLGLERISAVYKKLGSPKIAQKVITIAGTNGKGSCVVWAENLALAHNLKVGSFTSPHLLDYCERIKINGEKISEAKLCEVFELIDKARGELSLSFFEWSALAGFLLFAEQNLDLVILEVGLGGRLDATNIIDADCAIFSKIGLDHTDYLGDSIEKIAIEKAGIIRPNQLIAFADKNPPENLLKIAQANSPNLLRLDKELFITAGEKLNIKTPKNNFNCDYPKFLVGEHQFGHLAAVLGVLETLFNLEEQKINAVSQKAKNPARLLVIEDKKTIIDVAHNPDSAEVLAKFLKTRKEKKYLFVVGILKDKDQRGILNNFKDLGELFYFASLPTARGDTAENLALIAAQSGIKQEKIKLFNEVQSAYLAAIKTDLVVVVMGSFLTATEVLKILGVNFYE